MKIRLHGVRGSLPTPIPSSEFTSKMEVILNSAIADYKKNPKGFEVKKFLKQHQAENLLLGGNTTCVSVLTDSNELIIFDMGTGIRILGNELAAKAFSEGITVHIFLTHTHWDHIQGWPFFKPAYSPQTTVNFYSLIPNLQERLERQQHPENFPISLDMMASKKNFHVLKENESLKVGSVAITPFFLTHPGTCTGYKIQNGVRNFLFCTDVEIEEDNPHFLEKVKPILEKTNLLIIDAQYSEEEAEKKKGWGHTSMNRAVHFAESIHAEEVVLTHHEPDHSDAKIQSIFQDEALPEQDKIKVTLAQEGMEFLL